MIQKGKTYEYEVNGELRMGIVTGIGPNITLDNGDVVPKEAFELTCALINPDDNDNVAVKTDVEIPHVKIEYDKDGFPVLPKNGISEIEDVANPGNYQISIKKTIPSNNSPIIQLIDKAEKQNFLISIDVSGIDKALYSILKLSFSEDKDVIIEHMINMSLSSKEFHDQLVEKLKKYYEA